MKKLIILIISIATVSNAFAQYYTPLHISIDKYTILDSAHLKIHYKLNYIKDTLNTKQISEDMQTLLIGEKLSKYYSQSYYDHNEYIRELIKKRGGMVFRGQRAVLTATKYLKITQAEK